MDSADRLALVIREIAIADTESEPAEVWEGDAFDRYDRTGRKSTNLLVRERSRLVETAPGAWVCETWLCPKCGTRMWAEQTPFGPGWFGGGQPGCCW